MTRKICFALGLLVLAVPTFAQAPRGGGAPAAALPLEAGASQADVDKSLLAAPAPLKAGATVIKWKSDLSGYETLRKGNNRLVCFDKSGLPGQLPHRQPRPGAAEHEVRVRNGPGQAAGRPHRR
jgi:hypothetical protein